jgi:two-component system OmpR family response regulator
MTHIAIVEDDPTLASNYADLLSREKWEVTSFSSREDASIGIVSCHPDLALIDVGLGAEEDGGFLLCRELRMIPETKTLPIIFLTSRSEQMDRIQGLNLGADDYCSKDQSMDVTVAVIKALLRRVDFSKLPDSNPRESKKVGSLTLFPDDMRASWKNIQVDITVGEYDILAKLARHAGMLRTHDQLTIRDSVVSKNTVTSNIKRLRQKFEKIDPNFNAIQTEHGRGYSWKKD